MGIIKNLALCAALLAAGCATHPESLGQGALPPTWEMEPAATASAVTFQSVAASGATVHMAHGDGTTYYRRSLDQGRSWLPWTDLGRGTLYLEDPLAADGATVGIVTVDAAESVTDFIGERSVGDLYIRLSRDEGAHWEPPRRLTWGAKALRVTLSIAGATIHAAWMDYRTGRWEIRYLRSIDGGTNWDPERIIAPGMNAVGAERPSIEAVGGQVHLAWMDARDDSPRCRIERGVSLPNCTEIYYARSLDAGAAWTAPRRLTNDAPYSGRPDVAVDGETVVILFDRRTEDTLNDVGLLRSTDRGDTWAQSVLAPAPGEQTHGRSVHGGGGFHAAWMDSQGGSYQLYYSFSGDGAAWSPPEMAPSSSGAGAPAIAVTDGYAHISWSAPNLKYIRRRLDTSF